MEVPKIINTQELSMVDSSSFESLVDTIMCSIKYSIKFALSDEEVCQLLIFNSIVNHMLCIFFNLNIWHYIHIGLNNGI